MIHVLYVDPAGGVRSGYLTERSSEGACELVLVSRTGRLLDPSEVLAVLTPSHPTENQRTAFWRASAAGFRLETR